MFIENFLEALFRLLFALSVFSVSLVLGQLYVYFLKPRSQNEFVS